jgi:hypothetical protein
MSEEPAPYIVSGKSIRRNAYRKMVLGALQLLAGLYELWMGEDSPRTADILRNS